MFHLCFLDACFKCLYLDVAYVSHVCCICVLSDVAHGCNGFQLFSVFFSNVSEACFKCFNCLQTYVATVVFGCFIPQSRHSIHTNNGWAMGVTASGSGWALGRGGCVRHGWELGHRRVVTWGAMGAQFCFDSILHEGGTAGASNGSHVWT